MNGLSGWIKIVQLMNVSVIGTIVAHFSIFISGALGFCKLKVGRSSYESLSIGRLDSQEHESS